MMLIRLLIWIGFVRRRANDSILWPFHIPPRHIFKDWNSFRGWARFWGPFYIFRNHPGVIKWVPGRLLPRRWGFGVCGFEFGDRGG